eukprot:4960234-Lingulodinium_polyedra.AAC.1
MRYVWHFHNCKPDQISALNHVEIALYRRSVGKLLCLGPIIPDINYAAQYFIRDARKPTNHDMSKLRHRL